MKKFLALAAAGLAIVGAGFITAPAANAATVTPQGMNVCHTVKVKHTTSPCWNATPGIPNPCVYYTTKTVCVQY